jgi:sortase A
VYNPLVRKARSPEDLSVDELRQLLVEKRRKDRLQHLERFRTTGRAVNVTPEGQNTSTGYLHSNTQSETSQEQLEAYSHERLKTTLDRFLLAIEILAVFGLIFVVYSGIRMLRDLNTQFAQDLAPPTLTPTPLIVPVVLPSGHTPPNSPGGAQPNQAEIPAHLLPLYQSLAEIPIPTPGPEQAIQIQIPSINVDAPIVQGDSWEQLKKGIAQHIGSADPGQPGNLVLSAHDDVYGELFRYLDQMVSGDQIIIYSAQHSFTYYVTNIKIVEPTDVEVMAPTADVTITLISCYPYMVDNKRIVVQGSFQGGSK